MIFIHFPDNTFGEIELEEAEFAQLLGFARKGVRISVPILMQSKIVFVNILDIRHKESK